MVNSKDWKKKKDLMDTFIRQSSEFSWFIAGLLSFLYFIFSISRHIKNRLPIWSAGTVSLNFSQSRWTCPFPPMNKTMLIYASHCASLGIPLCSIKEETNCRNWNWEAESTFFFLPPHSKWFSKLSNRATELSNNVYGYFLGIDNWERATKAVARH